jgi:glycosyltransferase involved in cell wall biosynthesis
MMGPQELFGQMVKKLLAAKKLPALGLLAARRIARRLRGKLAERGAAMPYELVVGRQWGKYLFEHTQIRKSRYDFIFACVGHGDEYLLATAFALAKKLNAPMVVDFRDLWSEHHEESRFTGRQRALVRQYEHKLLSRTVLLSVPQKPMAQKFEQYLHIPVHITSHSAHIEPGWPDGEVVAGEFRLLYAGKIYAGNPGLDMLFGLLRELARVDLPKSVKCHFYTDDPDALKQMAQEEGVAGSVVAHGWVSPAEVWRQMRSAHLLLIFDGGFFRGMPLIMTKTYQYALSGRPILALSKNGNESYEAFFARYNAGTVCTSVTDAAQWAAQLARDERNYTSLPPLKDVPTRPQIAREFAGAIENILKKD